jgi:hypothetical protein
MPGRISCTADCWTADNTKGSYLGVTAHWIEVVGKKWELRTNVIGFRAISGEHSGWNLGRYLIGACDRVGICSKNGSKVSPIMGILLISIIDNGQRYSCTQLPLTTRLTMTPHAKQSRKYIQRGSMTSGTMTKTSSRMYTTSNVRLY